MPESGEVGEGDDIETTREMWRLRLHRRSRRRKSDTEGCVVCPRRSPKSGKKRGEELVFPLENGERRS
jgi:hypothetical protein